MADKPIRCREIIIATHNNQPYLQIDGEEYWFTPNDVVILRPIGADHDANGLAWRLEIQADFIEAPMPSPDTVLPAFMAWLGRNKAYATVLQARMEQTGKDMQAVLMEIIEANHAALGKKAEDQRRAKITAARSRVEDEP